MCGPSMPSQETSRFAEARPWAKRVLEKEGCLTLGQTAAGRKPLGTEQETALGPGDKRVSDGRAFRTFERTSLTSQRTERHPSVEVGRPAGPLRMQSGGGEEKGCGGVG